MYSKAKIFNMSLGFLLLQRQIVDTETDKSNEAKVLNTHWDAALRSTLEDLDLDSTSSQITLELIEENPNEFWRYSYKYPSDCAFLRRIQSCARTDNRDTFINKRVSIKDGEKCIFTNQPNAIAEYISYNTPLTKMSATVGICIALRLAMLASPLITGKGANKIKQDITANYLAYKMEAQEQDRNENRSFEPEWVESDFVRTRMS